MDNTGQIGLQLTAKYSNLPAQLSRISLAMGNVDWSHLSSPHLTDWVFMTTRRVTTGSMFHVGGNKKTSHTKPIMMPGRRLSVSDLPPSRIWLEVDEPIINCILGLTFDPVGWWTGESVHCGPPSYHELMHIWDKNKWNIWYLNVFLHEVTRSFYSSQVTGAGGLWAIWSSK